jgi:cysteinyl-tRNA synthetase
MHNGLLKLGSGKMAGSVGNVLNVADALKHVGGEVLRFFMLNTHYRSPIDLGEWDPRDKDASPIPSGLEAVKKSYENFSRFAERYQRITGKSFYALEAPTKAREKTFLNAQFGELYSRFRELMNDDFNTGGACGVLFELITALNKLADSAKLEDPKADETQKPAFLEGALLLKELSQILGLFFEEPKAATLGGDDKLVAGLMQLLIELRGNLRTEAKKLEKGNPAVKVMFDQTDLIRKKLAELGVVMEDRAGGTTWKVG